MKKPKIVFIDRDGVINRITLGNYIRHISEFKLLPNVKKSLAKLTHAGYEIHIISNQQGVAKGLMTQAQLAEVTQLLMKRIEQSGGKINSANYCTHLESENCRCRKPKTGLFRQAMKGRKIDFRNTWMIGDSWRDIEAGRNIGCKTIWIGTTAYLTKNFTPPPFPVRGQTVIHDGHQISPDYCVRNLAQAVNLILKAK